MSHTQGCYEIRVRVYGVAEWLFRQVDCLPFLPMVCLVMVVLRDSLETEGNLSVLGAMNFRIESR